AVESRRSAHVRFRRYDFLHGQVRSDPRAAAACPAGGIVKNYLQAEPPGFRDGVPEQFPPLRTPKTDRARRNILNYIQKNRATDADAVHGFQIGSDPLASNIAI